MGLDITYFRQLEVLSGVSANEDGEVPDYDTQWTPGPSMKWSESVWPGRGAPLDPDAVYTWSDASGFRAGSYGGYSAWRNWLSGLADGDDFSELIHFADNEGVIGSVVAAKLLVDFVKNETRIEATRSGISGDYYMEKYREWKTAFEFAADGGAVDFH